MLLWSWSLIPSHPHCEVWYSAAILVLLIVVESLAVDGMSGDGENESDEIPVDLDNLTEG
jgi:hypothetical protein